MILLVIKSCKEVLFCCVRALLFGFLTIIAKWQNVCTHEMGKLVAGLVVKLSHMSIDEC